METKHRRDLVLFSLEQRGRSDPQALSEQLSEGVPSMCAVPRPYLNADLAALDRAGQVQVVGTASGRRGPKMKIYQITAKGTRHLQDRRDRLIAEGPPVPNDFAHELSEFLDLVAFVAFERPKAVAGFVSQRIEAIHQQRAAVVRELKDVSWIRPYETWKPKLKKTMLAMLEAEAQALAAWIEDEAQIIGGDDAGLKRAMEPADSTDDIESKSAGTESGERAAPSETVDDVNGAPDSGTADEDEPYVPWRGGDGWGDD